MTGASILNFILSQTDKNSNDTAYRALALSWLKLVIKDIAGRQDNFHWRFLEVREKLVELTADTFSYDLATIAADFDTTKALTVYDKINDIPLDFIDYMRFKQLIADETINSGDATMYTIFANALLLFPVPDFDAITGTADGTTANKLVDSTATFITDGVKVGMRATDTVSGQTAIITALDSETTLSLDTDIFVATEPYSIKSNIYLDYVKVITAPADDATALLIPDKYEKVVIDGVLEWAYGFEPTLGSKAEKKLDYEAGIQRMINENGQIISENKRPVSHRMKHFGSNELNEQEFPLDRSAF